MWLSLKSNLKLKGDLASLHRQGVTVHGTFAKVVIIALRELHSYTL